jgi:hypothetical protein
MRFSAFFVLILAFMMVTPGWAQIAQVTEGQEVTSKSLTKKLPQPAWVVDSFEGVIYLLKEGASPTDFKKLEGKDPVPLFQGDRLILSKSSQAVIFDGLKNVTHKLDEGQPSKSIEVPAPPPENSLFERLLATSAQRQRQVVSAGFAIRPGISPSARIATPRRDGNFAGDLPPKPMIKLKHCAGQTIVLRLKELSEKDATSGTVLCEITLDAKDAVQTVDWILDEISNDIAGDTNWFLVELLVNGTVKDTRRLSRMGADLKAEFETDKKTLMDELEIDTPEELDTNPANEYLEEYYNLVGEE